MSDTHFWALIEGVPRADRITGRYADALAVQLARLPIPRIASFRITLLNKLEGLLNWPMWLAADLIHGGHCSEDSFLYFRLWIAAQGDIVFAGALANPDALARHPRIVPLSQKRDERWANEDFPHMDDLLYAPDIAFDVVLAKLRPEIASGVERPDEFDSRPREAPWKPMPPDFGSERMIRMRIPELAAIFRQS